MNREGRRLHTVRNLQKIARALCGARPDAILALAQRLGASEDTMKTWRADYRNIPAGIQFRLVRLLGLTPVETKWRRDRWVVGRGLPMKTGECRLYVMHTWPPRFRCRLVTLRPETGYPSPAQGDADILSGLFYDRSDVCPVEFEWLDRVPSQRRLQKLVEEMLDALEQFDESLAGNVPDGWRPSRCGE